MGEGEASERETHEGGPDRKAVPDPTQDGPTQITAGTHLPVGKAWVNRSSV